jgi:hypothetical protein
MMEDLGIDSIDVLKIEAEGFEPEVLAGATGCLHLCKTVVVDVGPERNGRDTAAACVDLLYANGFYLFDTRMLSGRMRFERAQEKVRG